MKAAVLFQYNTPLVIEDIDIEKPKEGEVLVRIKSAGVCHSDLYVLEGATPVPTPVVSGHEAVGVVEEVGPGVKNLQPGDWVVTSFVWPCGRCRNCVRGRENLCETFAQVRLKGTLLDGTTRLRKRSGEEVRAFLGGTWAEASVVPATAVAKLPEGLRGRQELAMLGCAFLTAYGAVVNSGSVSPGDTVVVVGTGGVGLSAVQVAKAVGARVIAVGRNPDKLKVAAELGAEVVNTREGDPVKAVRDLTEGRGADVVVEAVGNDDTIQMAVDMAALGGRVVLVGLMPVGHKTPLGLARVVRGGIQIVGSYGARPRVDLPAVVDMVKRGLLKPEKLAGPTYRLEEINQAVEALRSGKAIRPLVVP
ncbi:succinate semialdehyde reductase (NADPH) [Pyrobaculum islandicum DSM 4184]|uniref:Succinate semialdehyde reductase (NADPH) n=1 Tax=Pyrobaculum islandicum (strain DSM 4184 / JCM 9189 / GEO3) TaxID=384616 RepID=A1RR49_PYRIL|nr:zinc-binding dehydrogenase [Pyrobaculum islandicum]ABL87431.1 succinate semialdehyde reductase (NADPH) [Pyrobaculum islandicum DSM 4184]